MMNKNRKNRDNSSFSTPVVLGVQRYSEAKLKNLTVTRVFSGSFMITPTCLFRMTCLFLFSFFLTPESQAEETTIVDSGTCGNDCHWVLDNKGNFNITGSGTMQKYHPTCVGTPSVCTTDSPWFQYRNQIKNVDIQGVTNVSDGAFYYIHIKNLTLGDTVTRLGWDAFEQHSVQNIELPGSLTNVGNQALATSSKQNYTIIIPDTLKNFDSTSFGNSYRNLNIICRGENAKCDNIKDKMLELGYNINFSLANSQTCDSESFYWSGTDCRRKKNGINCAENWKKMEDWCNRIRYTPAEAAKVLHDDNTNSVTITFKK